MNCPALIHHGNFFLFSWHVQFEPFRVGLHACMQMTFLLHTCILAFLMSSYGSKKLFIVIVCLCPPEFFWLFATAARDLLYWATLLGIKERNRFPTLIGVQQICQGAPVGFSASIPVPRVWTPGVLFCFFFISVWDRDSCILTLHSSGIHFTFVNHLPFHLFFFSTFWPVI